VYEGGERGKCPGHWRPRLPDTRYTRHGRFRLTAGGFARASGIMRPPPNHDTETPVFGNGNNHKLKIFSGRANRPLAENIARVLGVPLGRATLGDFPDGETSVPHRRGRPRPGRVLGAVYLHAGQPAPDGAAHHAGRVQNAPARRESRRCCRTTAMPGRTARTRAACPSPRNSSPTLITRAGADSRTRPRPTRRSDPGFLRHSRRSPVRGQGTGQARSAA